MSNNGYKSGPLVTVLMSTYNRSGYVRQALDSILQQTYTNLEVILIRDGGTEVLPVISDVTDPRVIFIDRPMNKGLPYSFNEALSRARGKYICYLGDDDLFYPRHIEILLDALEGQDEYAVAYSDLYKVHCRIERDGTRTVLGKNVEVSRDFDRMVMLHFNHALHVSLMHRRDIMEKIGPYNENLNVLIDWDLTRRMSFYTDFKHVHAVTGEFYAPVADCDRISVQRRKNVGDFTRNLLTIRSSRPPKPWPKLEDMSIILLADRLNERTYRALSDIWANTFYPYKIYLPLPKCDLDNLRTVVPNITGIPVEPGCGDNYKIDRAMQFCDGENIAIVPVDYQIGKDEVAWIEKSLYPLMKSKELNQAYEIRGSSIDCWAGVFKRQQVEHIRSRFGHMSIRDGAIAAGIDVRPPKFEEYPFQFDNLVDGITELEDNGDWLKASNMQKYAYENHENELWMKTRRANAFYHAGKYQYSVSVAKELNSIRPTVATLLIEARAHKKMQDYASAIELYKRAEQILEGSELIWT